jgi:uncharacterized protein YfaS (alpha-2-macroglobulin family)
MINFLKSKKNFVIIFLMLLIISAFSLSIYYSVSVDAAGVEENPNRARIYIDGQDKGKSRGGIVSLSTLDEPAVYMSGYNIPGSVHINVYKADSESLLDFLVHDDKNNQINPNVDTSQFSFVASLDADLPGGRYSYRGGKKIVLPVEAEGIFLLDIIAGNTSHFAYVIRSNFGVIAHEAQNDIIFWSQDFTSKLSKTDGVVKTYNLQDKKTLLDQAQINQEGIAKTKKTKEADIALISSGSSESLIFLNLKYLNRNYGPSSDFVEPQPSTRYFAFTDRPIYKPGDTVKYKAILRSDLDVSYQLLEGELNIEVFTGHGDSRIVVHTDKKIISKYGAVDGEFVLPEHGRTGNYTITIKKEGEQAVSRGGWWGTYVPSANINFQVEHYRKPEYTIDLEVEKTRIIAGNNLRFAIKGNYFSGQPLNSKTVSYTVKRTRYHEPSNLKWFDRNDNSYSYGWWYGNETVKEGVVTLNEDGMADVVLENVESGPKHDHSHVYIIEAIYKDSTQNQVTARKNILVLNADYGIFQADDYYSLQAGDSKNIKFKIISYEEGQWVGKRDVKVNIERREWVCQDRYWQCQRETESFPEQILTSDEKGNFILRLNNIKNGSHDIRMSLEDDRGNVIEKKFYYWVGNYYYHYNDKGEMGSMSLAADKEEYFIGDVINVSAFSQIENRDAFVSIERDWVKKFQIVKIRNGEGELIFPVDGNDIPNVRISMSSFSDFSLSRAVKSVNVSAKKYQLDVEIKTDKEKYGPGDTVKLELTTRDLTGKGVSTESTVWLVDKALYELAGDKTGNIFDKFWSTRNSYTSMSHSLENLNMNMAEKGGCFSADTKILMKDGKRKEISQVRTGDTILTLSGENNNKLVEARVKNTHQAKVNGYLIINEKLKTTTNHILYVNNEWKEAGLIQVGDKLRNNNGNEEFVYSIEWQGGEFEVYNLEVENFHTFIAEDIWVHNDKGGGTRSNFEDAAYWNPRVRTNFLGKATVSFTLPDNLTTWVISAVSATLDTEVGQVKDEITVTKDVFIQPVLPNILRTGDGIIVSAVVNNFSGVDREFEVSLEFDSGRIASTTQTDVIKTKGFKQFSWPLFPEKENEAAIIRFSALDTENDEIGDIIELKIPVKEFGFWQTESFSGNGNKSYNIPAIASSSKEAKINFTMSLSAEGPIMSAMDYLVQYPYGCMEQTTSRFVPVVIAKENENLFKHKLKNKDLDGMVVGGIERLARFQNNDGGWAWWNSDQSEIALSTYVFEYIIKSRNAGIEVDKNVFESGSNFFRKLGTTTPDKYKASSENELKAYQKYILAMLGENIEEIKDFGNLDTEALSYAIMANAKAGFNESANKGIETLLNRAHKENDYMFWDAGDAEKYGSKNASNAMALRALLAVKYDRSIVDKVVANLLDNRKRSYWSNTYGTARVIQALVDYLRIYQLKGSNRYIIYLDDKKIKEGVIDKNNSYVEFAISQNDIKADGSELKLQQEGKLKIYSTLIVQTFNSDPQAGSISNILSIERSYKNEKGSNYSIGIGDVVEVTLKINGLEDQRRYLIIEDFLPAGMIPINTNLKNESRQSYQGRWYWYGDKDYTKDGVQVYLRYPGRNFREIKYRARVVNKGVYQTPPANVSYMYEPEIFAMTNAEIIEIVEESKEMEEIKKTAVENFTETVLDGEGFWKTKTGRIIKNLLLILLPLVVVFLALGIFIKKKYKGNNPEDEKSQNNENIEQK